jgi:uncharacterized protein YprB with RNaseH-like and TPR domain
MELYKNMVSSDKLKKLEKLTEKLGKTNLQFGADWVQKTSKSKPEVEPADSAAITTFGEIVCGEEVYGPAGKCFRIQNKLRTVWPESAAVTKLYKNVFLGAGQRLEIDSNDLELQSLVNAEPPRVTYLDIETCGFSGSNVFLIGWCYFDGENDLVAEQVFARDYSEEPAILALTCDRLRKTHVLTTFNGKRFDLPFIQERAAIHHQIVPPTLAHVDMLHRARSHWKKSLPNCKLQTLEKILCGRERKGDIPGSAIGQAYHDFVQNGDARKIKTIIHHNFLDIVTLTELTARLLGGYEPDSMF